MASCTPLLIHCWQEEKAGVEGIEVAPDSLLKHVLALTSTTGHRHYQNDIALGESVDYITIQLQGYGLESELQEYNVEGTTYANVISRYGTIGDPILVIGAHYDVCDNQPGADDNASGVGRTIGNCPGTRYRPTRARLPN